MRRLAAFTALVALAACSHTSELDELQRQLHELEGRTIEEQTFAAHLPDVRRQVEAAEERLVRSQANVPPKELARELFERARGELQATSIDSAAAGDAMTVTATSAAPPDEFLSGLHALAELSPWAKLSRLSRGAGGWQVTFEVAPSPACAPPASAPEPVVKLPPRQLLSNPQERERYVSKMEAERRILASLAKITGEVRKLAAEKKCDEAILATFASSDHVAAALPILDAAFGPGSPAKDATMELDPKRLRVGASPKDGHSYDEIRQAFARFGSISKVQQNEAGMTLVVDRQP